MIRRFISTSRRILCDKTSTTNLEYYDNYKNTYEEHAKTFSHVDASGNATMVDVGNVNKVFSFDEKNIFLKVNY